MWWIRLPFLMVMETVIYGIMICRHMRISLQEIVDFIYFGLIYNKDLKDGHKNTFLMSKGHGCMSQYIILNKLGILDDVHLEKYCKPGGIPCAPVAPCAPVGPANPATVILLFTHLPVGPAS